MWILILGGYGCVGLLTWTLFMILPAWLFLRRFPVYQWATPAIGPLAAIATLQGLYTLDCLSNGFFNLVYLTSSGGLICTLPSAFRRSSSIRDLSASGPIGPLDQSRPGSGRADSGLAEMGALSPDPINAGDLAPQTSQELLADRYKQLARTLKNQGQAAQAKAAWEHALDLLTNLASTHPEVREYQRLRWDCANDFAWFLLNEPDPSVGNPRTALRLVGEAVEADPECGTYWNTLGAACCRTGDATGAITALERSILLTDGGNAFDYLFLALAHAQLGQHEPAQAWHARADLWIQQQGSHRPELSRLSEEVCASLASGQQSSLVS
jgi:tetratricopeptide (TPR) repeat protein